MLQKSVSPPDPPGFSAFPIPNLHTRRRSAKRFLLCVLSFLRLVLASLGMLYGDSDETRCVFCALPHGHSVAKARGGFGKRLVRLLIPLCSRPVGGHGRSRRATIPLCWGLQWIGWIRCAGLCLGSCVRCHGQGRAPGVRFGPATLLAAHRQPYRARWISSFSAKFWSFFGSPCLHVLVLPCRKYAPGLVGVPIEQFEGGQKEAENW